MGGALLTISTLCRPRFTEDHHYVSGPRLEANILDRRSLKVMATTKRELDCPGLGVMLSADAGEAEVAAKSWTRAAKTT
jgi:hypothetical protein